MTRYIAVQRSVPALFAYAEVPESGDLETALLEDIARWAEPGSYELASRASRDDDFAVFEVPDDLEFEAGLVDATSVDRGSVFEDYRDFPLAGFLVRVGNEEEVDEAA